jgi:hypothetical protein
MDFMLVIFYEYPFKTTLLSIVDMNRYSEIFYQLIKQQLSW